MTSLAAVSDDVVEFVRKTARARVPGLRIWLFGSRARGTARRNSDYDIFVEVPDTLTSTLWTNFVWELNEHNPSLCRLDVVRSDEATDGLREEIAREGVLLTEGDSKS